MRRMIAALTVLIGVMAGARADEGVGIVAKQVFELERYETLGGAMIAPLRVGWEAYGTLSEARDNVVLIPHFFSGTSAAAGRYSAEQQLPGYWDPIIGPGRPIDTDRFYVVSVDSLVNLNANDPHVTTTGPATENAATGAPFGLDFPIVRIEDFVHVQKALLDQLGVTRLHAVVGASMGALQAYAWASEYPEMVERLVPVIGAGGADPFLVAWLDLWAAPIRNDPAWQDGAYDAKAPPATGLAEALKIVTLHARHHDWAAKGFGTAWADASADPGASLANRFKVDATLDAAGATRARTADANHFLYLVRANQLFAGVSAEAAAERLRRIEAPTLLIASKGDLVFLPPRIEETRDAIAADGTPVELVWLDAGNGHLDGIVAIAGAGEAIRAFLER
jgi:homoserine O-acetyltransferase